MNNNNLHELINRYESNIDMLYNDEHDELFKWRALKTWQEEWNKPSSVFESFSERFNAAKKNFDLFIDNSRMHPSTGIVKLWEKEPAAIEALFSDVLFAETESISEIQNNMDRFLDEYEALRQKHFPGNWSYKQDRHSASVFLAMNVPNINYVYKSTEALKMAKYTEFGLDIGSGQSFSLSNYYTLCDEIVNALNEHTSLLDKHFSRLTSDYYNDESLHLLAFDLMYCSNAYNFYKDLVEPVTQRTIKKPVKPAISAEEFEKIEAEKAAKIDELQDEISQLETKCSEAEDISLIDVQVISKQYGIGLVIGQSANMIKVRFENVEKTFVLNAKFLLRPRFENDEEIIAIFTDYADNKETIKKLNRQINELKSK